MKTIVVDLTNERAIAKLESAIELARGLKGTATSVKSPAFAEWWRDTEVGIAYIFGVDSRHVREFQAIRYTPGGHVISAGVDGWVNNTELYAREFMLGVDRACAVLRSMIKEITEYRPDDGEWNPCLGRSTDGRIGEEVFIVHGHDEALRESVARCISKLGLNPIILHERPNEGRTIIAKFDEESSPAGFAVVLLTPDDVGHPLGVETETKPRARQNVIFEMGYFMGRLGMGRVCALYREGVELPSDLQGIVYIKVDGNWKLDFARELKSAGFDIDVSGLI